MVLYKFCLSKIIPWTKNIYDFVVSPSVKRSPALLEPEVLSILIHKISSSFYCEVTMLYMYFCLLQIAVCGVT